MTETERLQIIALVKNEVVPAIGCTEPIAVALCVAKAVEVLNKRPENSRNDCKTAGYAKRVCKVCR